VLYVFIDESGDLGFTKKSSKYYVIASVETQNLNELNRVPKKVRKRLKKKEKDIPEFKFSRSSDKVRTIFLKKLNKTDSYFSVVILQKKMVYDHLRDKREKIHNYLAGFIAESLCMEYPDEVSFKVVVDKFMDRKRAEEFNWYFEKRMRENRRYGDVRLKIVHENSQNHPGLQAADFVAGAAFQKYERENEKYYNMIKDKIRSESRKWF